jgi:hypothetical protein
LVLCSGSRGLWGGFLVDFGGGLIHGGSGSVAGWLAVGLWGGLLRWWVFGPFWWCWGVFYFIFYVESNTAKYFSEHFLECNKNGKKKKKKKSLKSFVFENILHWKIFYSETNGV